MNSPRGPEEARTRDYATYPFLHVCSSPLIHKASSLKGTDCSPKFLKLPRISISLPSLRVQYFQFDISSKCNSLGREAIEGFRFLASFGPLGTGRTEGREKTQPFKRIHSRLFIGLNWFCNSERAGNKSPSISSESIHFIP